MKIIVTFIILFFLGCTRENIYPDPPIANKDSVKVLWNKEIYDSNSTGFISEPLLWNDKIVYTTNYFLNNSTIQCREMTTGNIIWDHTEGDLGNEGDQSIISPIYNNHLAWQNANDFYTIDLQNGKTIKKERFEGWVYARSSVIDGYIYAGINELSINQNEAWIMRRHLDENKWDSLLSIKKESGYAPFLSAASLYIHNSQDTFLLFHTGKWNFALSKGQANFYCFSLKAHKMLWQILDVDKEGCSTLPPTVWEGKAYFQGSNTIYCIDISSGKEIWHFSTPLPIYDIVQSPVIVEDGDLYMTSENNHSLYCLNASTGKLKWENTGGGNGVRKLNYFNDLIIFTSHYYLMIVDAHSGKTLWKIKSPNHSSAKQIAFNGWVPCSVNARDSVIYAADDAYIMAIKVPVRK